MACYGQNLGLTLKSCSHGDCPRCNPCLAPMDRNLHKTIPMHKDLGHDDTVAGMRMSPNSLDLLCTKILVSSGNGVGGHSPVWVCLCVSRASSFENWAPH